MLKLKLQEFIFEVKDEILSYEELGKEKADQWEQRFLQWVSHKNKDLKNVYCCIQDESEIFDIADEFYYANEQNSLNSYWDSFSLELK